MRARARYPALCQLLSAGCRGVLGAKLGELHTRLEGLQRSFECIQDFVRAYSPRLWREEFSQFVR